HIPAHLNPGEVVGLGLNEKELRSNKALSSYVIKDINKDPKLPFEEGYFDVVLNTVSVDYLTKPIEVFKEVGRVLKPGGLFLVIFSNRMFPQKAIKMWREATDDERIIIVEEFFKEAHLFGETKVFISKGRPRPSDDKYIDMCKFSDPVYAVYAEKLGASLRRKRPEIVIPYLTETRDDAQKNRQTRAHITCPHCGMAMKKWQVPDNPFCQTWDNDFMYICFNDFCPYFVRGWELMYKQTFQTMSYRCMFNPKNGKFSPIPVPSPNALKEGIVDE
ncbi:MAG: methyltransferase domain-containing protein, partial [Desulfatiglandales bacterium]